MLATAEHTTHPAVAAAELAVATAAKPIRSGQSALDKAIAAAEAYMEGEYAHANSTHTAAEAAAVLWNDSHRKACKAASAAVLVPQELCFKCDPATELVRMEMHYADGHSRVMDYRRDGFTPTDRESLIKHCAEQGLEPKGYLAIWDKWAKARSAAEDAAMPPEWHVAQEAFNVAELAWNKALDRQVELANAIMKVRVNSAAEAIRQVEAYARTMQIDDPTHYADHEDALTIASSLIKSLRLMAGQVPQ